MLKGILEMIFGSMLNSIDKKKKAKWEKMTLEERKRKNLMNLLGGILIPIILFLLVFLSAVI